MMGIEGSFEAREPAALRIPLRGDFGQMFAREAGKIRDAELELLHTAMICRLPSRCPDDGLDKLGEVFLIERYPGESHDSYRARLVGAWSAWEKAGSAAAIKEQIQAFGIVDVAVYPIDRLDFGPDPAAFYSEFWVVIGPDTGPTFTNSAAERRILKRIILKWKAAHGYPVELLFVDSTGALLGMGMTLGGFTLGASGIDRYRIGRTLGATMLPLGDSGCILGGYDLT